MRVGEEGVPLAVRRVARGEEDLVECDGISGLDHVAVHHHREAALGRGHHLQTVPLRGAALVEAARLPGRGDRVFGGVGEGVGADGGGTRVQRTASGKQGVCAGGGAAATVVRRNKVRCLVGVRVPEPRAQEESVKWSRGGGGHHRTDADGCMQRIRSSVRLFKLFDNKTILARGGLHGAGLDGGEGACGAVLKALVKRKHARGIGVVVGPVVTGGTVVHFHLQVNTSHDGAAGDGKVDNRVGGAAAARGKAVDVIVQVGAIGWESEVNVAAAVVHLSCCDQRRRVDGHLHHAVIGDVLRRGDRHCALVGKDGGGHGGVDRGVSATQHPRIVDVALVR
mmetsp:Transcript_25625/g.45616  ORF Transcript_25625/g.45616 Transcript_25625/m.45616 type:complete len:338 (-) Transcript_25625:1498-2511(-)